MRNEYRLDLTVCLGRSLFSGPDLEALEGVLKTRAKAWSSGLHVWREGKRRISDSFAASIREVAAEKGQLFHELVAKHGAGPYPRSTGTVELRGKDGSLIVVIGLDEYIFAPSSGRYLWGNTITFQLCRPQCGGEPAHVFARSVAEDCCATMKAFYARSHLLEEREAKNISREGGGMMAIGMDVSRYLPGLYWLNFFGEPYCKLIGADLLLGAPTLEAKRVGDGVLLVTDEEPASWNAPDGRQPDVLTHIGEQFFFLRDRIDRETVAPPYGLKELRRFARFS